MQSSLLLNKPKQVNGAEVTAPLSSGLSAQGFLLKKERVNHCLKVGDRMEAVERKEVSDRMEATRPLGRRWVPQKAMPGLPKQNGLETDPSSTPDSAVCPRVSNLTRGGGGGWWWVAAFSELPWLPSR